MSRLEAITRRRKKAHAKFTALKSPVYQAFLEMEKAAYVDGALPKKTKELIAVGISVVTDCESCMQWHIEQAAQAGSSMRADVLIRRYWRRLRSGSRWAADRRRCPPGSPSK